MASNVTDWGAAQYLSMIFGLITPPAGYYIALCTEEPGTVADGTVLTEIEPTDTAYSRVYYPAGLSAWSDPTIDLNTSNLNQVDFGVPGIDWGVITHYAICDSITDGNLYSYGEFNVPVYVSSTYEVAIPIGGITVALYNQLPSIANQ